ncbi:MAG: hypothetical protein BZ136_08395 [Methanosphaera sp. rholeuAM74]|nr:MAG: hypothetical protein BZ136_08395 [Methanosphaera sp. rholeuAM74]
MKKSYSKYKERTPEETILAIQQILQKAGIFTVLRWTGENGNGYFSNRITLHPTEIGVNGKGTDEIYSTASGYGELMERLQNNFLLGGMLGNDPDYSKGLFRASPDEEDVPLADVLDDPDPFTKYVFDQLKNEDENSDGPALCNLFSYKRNGKAYIPCIPFADISQGRTVKVPAFVARWFSGSNGMAAGNTMEEALVQGLSEMLEREVNLMILEGSAVPPEIPDEELSKCELFPLIEELRKNDTFKVRILDCSLGKGWPVVALCIQNLEKGTFGINLGAHPSFQVAIERTITEAVQGRSFEEYAEQYRIGSTQDAACNANIINVCQGNNGVYPAALFYNEADWSFSPWTRFNADSNREFLDEMLGMLREDGYEPLLRDCSFMGFPACYILIPGFRMIRKINGNSVRLRRTLIRAAADFVKFPKLSDEEASRLMMLLRHNRNIIGNDLAGLLSGVPISADQYKNDRLAAFLALRLENFEEASGFFGKTLIRAKDESERRYLLCMKKYSDYRREGLDNEQAHRLLKQMYNSEAADRVCSDTSDLSVILEKYYTKLNCPDCGNCAYKSDCCYTEQKELIIKLCAAMKKENASQERLLELINNSSSCSLMKQ